jgi:hypothetical protein
MSDLAIQCGGASTSRVFQMSSGGTVYAAQFNAFGVLGCSGIFGNSTEKFLATQVVPPGTGRCRASLTPRSTSAAPTTRSGPTDTPTSAAARPRPAPSTSSSWTTNSKTTIGDVYLTAENSSWRGLDIKGNINTTNVFYGLRAEGYNASTPCAGSVVKIEGGLNTFYEPWVAFSMNAPLAGENGVIEVTGGDTLIDRRSTTAATPQRRCPGRR